MPCTEKDCAISQLPGVVIQISPEGSTFHSCLTRVFPRASAQTRTDLPRPLPSSLAELGLSLTVLTEHLYPSHFSNPPPVAHSWLHAVFSLAMPNSSRSRRTLWPGSSCEFYKRRGDGSHGTQRRSCRYFWLSRRCARFRCRRLSPFLYECAPLCFVCSLGPWRVYIFQ